MSVGSSSEYEFTGVALASLMEMAGVAECSKVIVEPLEGECAEIDPRDAKKYFILVADGYADGGEIPTYAGGPIKMVFPATDYHELNNKYDTSMWRWIAEIEFVK